MEKGGDFMKKSVKIALIIGAIALVLGVGLVGTKGGAGDPPFTLINQLI